MKPAVLCAALALGCSMSLSDAAWAQRANYEAMVAEHARANGIPEALVHRVIVRESRYQPHLVGRGGTIGLMQIKLATARGLGYTGTAAGLHDPNTNLTYAVRYLAGPESAWVTGQSFAVDGGQELRKNPDLSDMLKANVGEEAWAAVKKGKAP